MFMIPQSFPGNSQKSHSTITAVRPSVLRSREFEPNVPQHIEYALGPLLVSNLSHDFNQLTDPTNQGKRLACGEHLGLRQGIQFYDSYDAIPPPKIVCTLARYRRPNRHERCRS